MRARVGMGDIRERELYRDAKAWARGLGPKYHGQSSGCGRPGASASGGALKKGAVKDAEQLWKEGDPTHM